MVKTPKTRHARTQREPVTIDLGPDEVRRIEDEAAAADDARAGDAADGEAIVDAVQPGAAAQGGATPGGAGDAEPAAADLVPEPAAAEAPDTQFAAAAPEEQASTGAPRHEPPHFGRPRPQSMEEPAVAPAPPPTRPGRASAIAAGLIGGIIALAGAGALQYAGLLPSPGAPAGDASALAALQSEIDTLKQQVAGLGDGSAAAGIEELRQALGESTATVGNLSAAVDKISADLAALKSAVEADGTGGGEAAAQLGTRLDALEAAVAELRRNDDGAAPADLAQLAGRLDTIEKAVNAAGAQTVDAETRIATLEKSLADIAAKVEAQADQPRIALAIAASALKAAVDRGGPFASEVETFAAVAPDSPELAELRALAKEGVPARAELLAAAPDAAIAMIGAARTVDENAGFFERLLASAESLIKVRPIGVVEGEGVDAIVARMEAALKAGDLARALAEYETLPEGPKAAGAAFAGQIRLRQKAEELVDKALAGALKA